MRKLLTVAVMSTMLAWCTPSIAAASDQDVAALKKQVREQATEIGNLRGRVAALESQLKRLRKEMRQMRWEPTAENKSEDRPASWLRLRGSMPGLDQWAGATAVQRRKWAKNARGTRAVGVAYVTGWSRGYYRAEWDRSDWNVQIRATIDARHRDQERELEVWLYIRTAGATELDLPEGTPVHFRGRIHKLDSGPEGLKRIQVIDCRLRRVSQGE